MAKALVTLKPEMNIFQAIDLLLKHRISGASVVDDNKKLVGVLSEKDCLRVFVEGAFFQLAGGSVSDFMSRNVTTVRPDDDVFKIADIFLKNSFRRLPVLDGEVLVGQVSRRDVLNVSRRILEESSVRKEWTDSKYLSDEVKAALADKPPPESKG